MAGFPAQREGVFYLAEGGQETEIMYKHGHDLPEFAMFPTMAREAVMKRFVEGVARNQGGLFPAHLDDFVHEDNPVRAVDAFVEMLDLRSLGFAAVDPSVTGRPGYHPAVLLKLYVRSSPDARRTNSSRSGGGSMTTCSTPCGPGSAACRTP
jgi:hypothetical protein